VDQTRGLRAQPSATVSVTPRGIAVAACAASVACAAVDAALTGRVGLAFDMCFVIICVAIALTFRSEDLYTAASMPPLVFAVTVGSIALVAPTALADNAAGFGQGFLDGLAHNASWLAAGYAGTLLALAGRAAGNRT
jgi:hypothetical protein